MRLSRKSIVIIPCQIGGRSPLYLPFWLARLLAAVNQTPFGVTKAPVGEFASPVQPRLESEKPLNIISFSFRLCIHISAYARVIPSTGIKCEDDFKLYTLKSNPISANALGWPFRIERTLAYSYASITPKPFTQQIYHTIRVKQGKISTCHSGSSRPVRLPKWQRNLLSLGGIYQIIVTNV